MPDWSALVSAAIPGSAAELRGLASTWSGRRAVLLGAAEILRTASIVSAQAWHSSPGAEAFSAALWSGRSIVGQQAVGHEAAAAALSNYLQVLTEAARTATGYVASGRAAEAVQLDIVTHHDVFSLGAAELGLPLSDSDLRARIKASDGQIATAQLNLQELQWEMAQAADVAAAAIRAATAILHETDAATARLVRPGAVDATLHASVGYRRWLEQWAAGHDPAGPVGADSLRSWSRLTPGEQRALIMRFPDAVGNASGVDAAGRDAANRIALTRDAAGIQRTLSARGMHWSPTLDPAAAPERQTVTAMLVAAGYSGAELVRARDVLAADYQLSMIATSSGAPTVQLLVYQPGAFGGKGRIAVAMGDVRTVDHVAVVVPGTTSQVPNYLGQEVSMSENLYRSCRGTGNGSVAVVAYIGYDAPGVDLSATNPVKAQVGAAAVAADFDDIARMRTAAGPGHVTGVFHSYATVLAGTMAKEFHPAIDDYVLAGSPGAGDASSAADMGRAGHVYDLASSSDPITTLAQQELDPGQRALLDAGAGAEIAGSDGLLIGALLSLAVGAVVADLGPDPAGSKFGSVRLEAESVDKFRLNLANHEYFRVGSEGLQSATAVVMNRRDLMHVAPTRQEPGQHYAGSDPEYSRPAHTR